jgi:hypothetical protein
LEVRRHTAVALGNQGILMKPVRLAHESAEPVPLDGMLEERFGSPDKHLSLPFRWLVGDAKRPRREAFAILIQSRNPQSSA